MPNETKANPICVCSHARSVHAPRASAAWGDERMVLACTVEDCACGPGCIHEGFVNADDSAPPLTLPTGKVTGIDAVVRAIEEADLLFSGCGCRGDHCPCSEARERMREVIGKHLRVVTEEMLRAALTAIFEQHDEEDSEAIERDDEPAELARLLYEALKGEK